MKTKQKEIKQASLTNNCPECFSNEGLLLTFYQKHIEGLLFKRATSQISDIIVCNNCNTTIYPVRWTDDIERVREFYQKTVEKPRTYFRLTGWGVLGLLIIFLIAVSIFMYYYYPEVLKEIL
ncbi:hypothetical protein OOZ15_14130 [Galbibacter sp. EGI 63066]|uniref:hypothetical protein n=1 Tax=Galbibacter sp. EGI 63066 TaxID=2993559 RepID=UPI0022493684|nr:hypothetical protein [Galbibacter sp. EGI 63066]MCX2681086.1 hypothetical protein [Galbibacter sp. EGI 63066]